MPRKHKPARPRKEALQGKILGEVLLKNPRVLKVLHEHGVHFCAGCFLTLTAPLDKVAAYHAVPDREAFLKDLHRALAGRPKS